MIPDSLFLSHEITFQVSRSSGPGGQNVNKVNSRVVLRFDVMSSGLLTNDQKALLLTRLSGRLSKEGVLLLPAQESRSQSRNKEDALRKFDELLKEAFTPVKKRRKTKPSKGSKEKRMKHKKSHSEKKQWRKKPV